MPSEDHETLRKQAKQDEACLINPLIKNGKYFVAPPSEDSDFKVLFQRLATAGAGRPVDRDGFPQGPWTPDLLADAISQIHANRTGVELRTVQLWFQENDRGISADNIRWLARIFGCDDPDATSEWQAKLSASRIRLAARRRGKRKGVAAALPESERSLAANVAAERTAHRLQAENLEDPRKRTGLAQRSEALFGEGWRLNLPAMVFAGAVTLQLGSYFVGIHSAVHVREDGIAKQVGFLWAPNWTVLFLVLMPLFLIFVADILTFWKGEGRGVVLSAGGQVRAHDSWTRNVDEASYTY